MGGHPASGRVGHARSALKAYEVYAAIGCYFSVHFGQEFAIARLRIVAAAFPVQSLRHGGQLIDEGDYPGIHWKIRREPFPA